MQVSFIILKIYLNNDNAFMLYEFVSNEYFLKLFFIEYLK